LNLANSGVPNRTRGPRRGNAKSSERIAAAYGDIYQMILEMGLGDRPPGEVARQVTKETFKRHGLYSLLQHTFDGSPYSALLVVFPELKAWEMRHVPQGFWEGEEGREHARDAVKWLIDRLGLRYASPQQIAQQVNFYTFDKYGLRGMLGRVYANSPYAALLDVYPEMEAWEREVVPREWWQGEVGRERAKEATRSMLRAMDLLDSPAEEVAKAVTQETFVDYGLAGMMGSVYKSSPYAALSDVLPDMRPYFMGHTPAGYWRGDAGREHAREAMRWLTAQLGVDAKAGREELKRRLTREIFVTYGLSGMLQTVYHSRLDDAIDDLIKAC
jgi:hypothetical protein